jgi:hypothetical protein
VELDAELLGFAREAQALTEARAPEGGAAARPRACLGARAAACCTSRRFPTPRRRQNRG